MKADRLESAEAAQEIHKMLKQAATGELTGFLVTLDTVTGKVETVSIGKDIPGKTTLDLLDHARQQLQQMAEAAPNADAVEEAN